MGEKVDLTGVEPGVVGVQGISAYDLAQRIVLFCTDPDLQVSDGMVRILEANLRVWKESGP